MVRSNIMRSLETSGRLIRGCCFFGIYLVCMNSSLSCHRPLPLYEVHASLIIQKPHRSTARRFIVAPNPGRSTLHSMALRCTFRELVSGYTSLDERVIYHSLVVFLLEDSRCLVKSPMVINVSVASLG